MATSILSCLKDFGIVIDNTLFSEYFPKTS